MYTRSQFHSHNSYSVAHLQKKIIEDQRTFHKDRSYNRDIKEIIWSEFWIN